MKLSKNQQSSFGIIVLGLLLAIIPATALGKSSGGGQWRRQEGNTGWRTRTQSLSKYDKKCAKFRNCHDASDGRWDGRGPRGSRVSNVLTTRVRRNRQYDYNYMLRNRRNREVRNNFLRYRERRARRVNDNR